MSNLIAFVKRELTRYIYNGVRMRSSPLLSFHGLDDCFNSSFGDDSALLSFHQGAFSQFVSSLHALMCDAHIIRRSCATGDVLRTPFKFPF